MPRRPARPEPTKIATTVESRLACLDALVALSSALKIPLAVRVLCLASARRVLALIACGCCLALPAQKATGAPSTSVADSAPHKQGGGEAYQGWVSAQVIDPGAPAKRTKDSGTGSAQFVPLGPGRSRLVVKANIRAPGDAGLVMEGSSSGAGWTGRAGGLRLAIDGNGNISGGGIEARHRIAFSGRASGHRFELRVETEKLALGARDALPVGTRIVFDYALGRVERDTRGNGSATAAEPDVKSPQAEKRPCKRTVWRPRYVGTPDGGGSTIRAPHCVD